MPCRVSAAATAGRAPHSTMLLSGQRLLGRCATAANTLTHTGSIVATPARSQMTASAARPGTSAGHAGPWGLRRGRGGRPASPRCSHRERSARCARPCLLARVARLVPARRRVMPGSARDLTRGHLGSGRPIQQHLRESVRFPRAPPTGRAFACRTAPAGQHGYQQGNLSPGTALTRTPAGAAAAVAPTRWWSWLDGCAPDVPYPSVPSVRSGQPRSTAVGAHACRAVGSAHPERSEGASQARGASGRGSTLPCPAGRSGP